jgi:hypothetical protein
MLKEPAPIAPQYLTNLQARYTNNPEFVPDCDGCSGGNNRVINPIGDRTIYFNDAAIQVATVSMFTLATISALVL